MIRNPQILGTCARRLCHTLLVTLSAPLWLGACGLKGPLYLPAAASTPAPATATTAPASAAPASAASASAPSTPNSPAR